jgi:hypothetical protein
MTRLLTETAVYDEPESWGRMSEGFPEIKGDVAYDMYVFANCVETIPYGSYVLMSERGRGDTESCLRVHGQYIEQIKADFLAAEKPNACTSMAHREKYGKLRPDGLREKAPKWRGTTNG